MNFTQVLPQSSVVISLRLSQDITTVDISRLLLMLQLIDELLISSYLAKKSTKVLEKRALPDRTSLIAFVSKSERVHTLKCQ